MRTRRMLLLIVVVLAGISMLAAGRPVAAQTELPPNVLVIVTDDQRADQTMSVMHRTRDYFGSGVNYPYAIATTPVCCPSRASIFTGRYAHNHGVRSNAAEEAGNLDHRTTLQYLLGRSGYRTGIFGKFLNGWHLNEAPPYFDEYAVNRAGYYGGRFGVGVDGVTDVRHVDRYSTDYLRMRASRFIKRTETNDAQPWLMFVTPYAPHAPSIPAPRHQDSRVPRLDTNPAMHENDLTDKPPQYANYAELFDYKQQAGRARRQMLTLKAVDGMVARLTDLLSATDETNTLVIFMSDNGYMWGEHALSAKATPYDPSLSIPLLIRWDGHLLPGQDERLVANIDIAPTVLQAVGLTGSEEMDGRSLFTQWDRESLLAEVYGAVSKPELRWASIVSRDYQYVEYYGGDEQVATFREYYDLIADPWQLDNLFADEDPSNDPDEASLSARLARYRACPLVSPCP